MSGYQVVIDALRHTGQAATRLADGLRGVNSAGTVPGGDAGMPGGQCVGKLAAVKQAWQDREKNLTAQLDTHAGNISKSVELYLTNEQAAANDLPAVEQPASGC